jgi:hypothetical protein
VYKSKKSESTESQQFKPDKQNKFLSDKNLRGPDRSNTSQEVAYKNRNLRSLSLSNASPNKQ